MINSKPNNNRFKLLLILAIIPLTVAAVFVGNEIMLNRYAKIIEDCRTRAGDCPGRIEALEKLIRSGRNLNGINLAEANLNGANLSGANLENANLENADLSSANLANTNLQAANLTKANLSGAKLNDANLSSANLSHAKINSTFFQPADLSGANLFQADLNGTEFRKTKGMTVEQIKAGNRWQSAKYDRSFSQKLTASQNELNAGQ